LGSILRDQAALPADEAEWLQRLTAEWQIVADLAFADLVLWVPVEKAGFVAAALRRPLTGSTMHYDEVVGVVASPAQAKDLSDALTLGMIQRHHEPRWNGAYGVREEIVPVGYQGRSIAVVTSHGNLGAVRAPSRLEINYVEVADELIGMIARGEFPATTAPTGSTRHNPRVGDGMVRLGTEGQVIYASPNAISAFHGAGLVADLTGTVLVEVLADALRGSSQVDEALPVVAMGRAPWNTEVTLGGVTLALRSVPLTNRGIRTGAVLLCRDVTELRRSELELMTKDATIREIHHRVKNNLQAVSALLRLQQRRSTNPSVESALGEAIRRVSTIATVHDTLSMSLSGQVDFDTVFGRTLRLAADAAAAGIKVQTVQEGSFGRVGGDDATIIAILLTELVTNAVAHGLAPCGGGTVWINATRSGMELEVSVADDGVGLPSKGAAAMSGLGMQIVESYATGELGGSIEWLPRPGGGTEVLVRVHLRE